MGGLADQVIDNVFAKKSKSQTAFRTWSDNLADYLIYALVITGFVLIPTAIVIKPPYYCNYCDNDPRIEKTLPAKQKYDLDNAFKDAKIKLPLLAPSIDMNPSYCRNYTNYYNPSIPILPENVLMAMTPEKQAKMEELLQPPPKFNPRWARLYCSFNGSIDTFLMYYPFFLLLVAFTLLAIERMFLASMKSKGTTEQLYSLLEQDGDRNNYEGGVEAVELKHKLKYKKRDFFSAYLNKSVLELVIAGCLLLYMVVRGMSKLKGSRDVICNIHGFIHECHGNPTSFYQHTLYVSISCTLLHMICQLATILRLVCPVGTFCRIMRKYRYQLVKSGKKTGKTEQEVLGDLQDIYYNSKDLKYNILNIHFKNS